MRLPTVQYIDALGLAFDFGIGTFQHYQDKSLAVRFSQGFVARHSIEAVMLAHAGISGPKRILEGENVFLNYRHLVLLIFHSSIEMRIFNS